MRMGLDEGSACPGYSDWIYSVLWDVAACMSERPAFDILLLSPFTLRVLIP